MLLLLPAAALAQTTRPAASDAWSQTVEKFAQAIVDADAAALVGLISQEVEIESLDSKADAVRLLARTRKGLIVATQGYPHPPKTLAEDLSTAFKNASLPEDVKRQMAMRDPEHARRANSVAGEWLGEMLQTRANDLVGVIAIWREGKVTDGEVSEVILVLLRAEMTAGKPRITRIVFGNPTAR
jgi:hypothetical protein